MAADHTAAVARWLTAQPGNHHQLSELAAIVDKTAPDRKVELAAVLAAVELLDTLGLVVFYRHVAQSAVAAPHRDGLQRIAAGDNLAEVARVVELARPVTIVRVCDRYAAWYRSPLRLPVGATTIGNGGAFGATPDDALAALRHQVQVAAAVEWPIADRDRGRPVR